MMKKIIALFCIATASTHAAEHQLHGVVMCVVLPMTALPVMSTVASANFTTARTISN